jgi:hypothetical protein
MTKDDDEEEKEDSEISLDIKNAPVGDDKFSDDDDKDGDHNDYKDSNDFDDFDNESEASDKEKYQVHMEKSNV